MYDVTFVIKAFDRPDVLARLLASIPAMYRDVPVIISDDGSKHFSGKLPRNCIHQKHEFDIGLSEGRNRGLSQVSTPFFLLLDDDFVWNKRTEFESMVNAVRQDEVDICTGNVGRFANSIGMFSTFEDAAGNHGALLQHKPKKCDTFSIGGSTYRRTHSGLNYFAARPEEVLAMGGWPSEVKITHEHFAFFYCALRAGLRVAKSRDGFIHHPPYKRPANYRKFRSGRGKQFLEPALDSMGLKAFRKKSGNRVMQNEQHPKFQFDWTTATKTEAQPLCVNI